VVNSTFRRSLAANLGAGNDTLEITGSDVRDLTRLNGGDGQDSLGAAGGQFKRSIGYANFEGVFNGPIPPTPPVPPPPIAPTAPTVTAASSAGESTAAAQIPFSFTFSQPVSGLIDTAIDVSNGTVSNLTSPDRRTFTFNVTPTADGVVTVSLPANAVTDDQGRQNSASNTVTVRSIRTDAGMVPRDAPPNPNDPNFVAASNGLATWDVVPGSGTAITGNTTRVQAFYTGWLTDGTSFDAGRTTGQPVPFTLPNGVIPGFAQGLIGMQVGGIRRIRIPAELGYGNNPPPGSSIPPNATLIFEVKLVTIG
jgi:FKBP-type peptidyl-prolyl cis-trans isomerase